MFLREGLLSTLSSVAQCGKSQSLGGPSHQAEGQRSLLGLSVHKPQAKHGERALRFLPSYGFYIWSPVTFGFFKSNPALCPFISSQSGPVILLKWASDLTNTCPLISSYSSRWFRPSSSWPLQPNLSSLAQGPTYHPAQLLLCTHCALSSASTLLPPLPSSTWPHPVFTHSSFTF